MAASPSRGGLGTGWASHSLSSPMASQSFSQNGEAPIPPPGQDPSRSPPAILETQPLHSPLGQVLPPPKRGRVPLTSFLIPSHSDDPAGALESPGIQSCLWTCLLFGCEQEVVPLRASATSKPCEHLPCVCAHVWSGGESYMRQCVLHTWHWGVQGASPV